jgi:hypothetical protein
MSSIPQWLRDTIPAWVFIGIAFWFIMQRALERREQPKNLAPTPYPRPVRDWRIVFMTLGFVAVSTAQLAHGAAPSSVNSSFQTVTQYTLAIIMGAGGLLTLAAAASGSEWWSAGLELAGCIFLAGAFFVYACGYVRTQGDWTQTIGAWFTSSLLVGNLLRAIQLFRNVG